MTGTIKLSLKGRIASIRRFRYMYELKKNVEYWKELYGLHDKNYELIIIPDYLPNRKSIKSYASFINSKHRRTCQKAKRESISTLAATKGIPETTESPNNGELRAEAKAV